MTWLSSLKTSLQLKWKNAGLGPMKGVLEAVCGLKTVELTNDVINILEIHYLYHNGTKTDRNFLIYGIQGHLLYKKGF